MDRTGNQPQVTASTAMRRFIEGKRQLPSRSDVKRARRIARALDRVLLSLEKGVELARVGARVSTPACEAGRKELLVVVEQLNALVYEGLHKPAPHGEGSSNRPILRGCADSRDFASGKEN